jgi:chromosome segregation ATPase
MQIRRIEISAFRCFKNSLVIEDIGDGVTLLVGDNEEGKSTVLAALQTVLFEKHSVGGAVADAMLPYGSKVRPEIKLEFDHNGEHYRLYKAFCQRPTANLEAGSGNRWSDDAAEEQLREMLDFTPPGKGGAKADHRGLQALFWVEQGSASAQPHINETAQTSLASALETEVGTVTGGERGRMLIKQIESRINEIFTSKTRKPAGAYKDAITRAAETRSRRDELVARLEEFEGKVDVLTRERGLLAKLEADDPIGVADMRLEKARNAIRNVEGLENSLKTAEANFKTAQAEYKLAKSRLDRRQQSRKEAGEADQEFAGLKAKELSAQEAVNDTQQAFNATEVAHRTAKAALNVAQNDATAARRLADLLRKSEELVAANGRLKKATTAEQEATQLTAKAKTSSLTSAVIDELRRLDSYAREEAARLRAVATLLELSPDEGRRAVINDAVVEVAALTLIEPTHIKLDGFGTIRVTPGGEDLASRREMAAAAAANLKLELNKHGVANLQDAVGLGKSRETWLNEAMIHRTTVKAHAPEGLDALNNHVARLEADLLRIREDIGDTVVLDITAEKASDRADELARKLKNAETQEREASDDLKDAKGALETAKKSFLVAADQRKAAENKAKALRDALDHSAKEGNDGDLEKALHDATAVQQAVSDEVGTVEKALAESDPVGARRELQAATEARGKVEASLRDKRQRVRDLEVELRTLGKDDTAAEIEVADGELARAEAQEGRLSHEAAALILLYDTLVSEEQIARETFLAPVRERIEPYLKRLFPGSELMLDDQTLKITHLRRDGQDEPYERLSIGTREQLAVLVRLAFADLLGEHGKKSPIILDDALVFSDDGRFEAMQQILDRAAERLQIIVLTCHERAYFGRGWATKRLQDSKSVTARRP